MRKTFKLMGKKTVNKNKSTITMRVTEELPSWYVLCPWRWGKLLQGGKFYSVKITHPLRGGGNWRKDLACLTPNVVLDKNDWEKISNMIYFHTPNIFMPPAVSVTKRVDLIEADYDFTRSRKNAKMTHALARSAMAGTEEADLVTEIIKVEKLSSGDGIKWFSQPKINEK